MTNSKGPLVLCLTSLTDLSGDRQVPPHLLVLAATLTGLPLPVELVL
jgi:hypothetical protein